ncbi:hypothetical protein [Gracilimonas tropica]|uniref:hypothetical protein n=1 Tax=Gracilimonas tropica TaxID=454600 RepID=UPI00035F3A80|nr:hypothetical protein [Gracilimonas tropica]
MTFLRSTVLFLFMFLCVQTIQAQNRQTPVSQQFRLAERIIRIAEPGQLTDSVNVWGDVGSSGRYLVPKGTSLPLLLSYSFGPQTLRDGQTNLDWSKMRVEINIQEYDEENQLQTMEEFRYRFEEPFPEGMNNFIVENNQTITVRVKRKPSFRDYVGVIAPAISAIATTIVIVDRLAGN